MSYFPDRPCTACGRFTMDVTRVDGGACVPLAFTHFYLECGGCGWTNVVAAAARDFNAVLDRVLPRAGAKPPEPDPPEPIAEDVPTISGSVIGYRAWRILDWALCGTYSTVPWVPGVNEAKCAPPHDAFGGPFARMLGYPPHPAPAEGCACGITALARFTRHDEHWARADVFGAIEAWSDETAGEPGRFILHSTGFRAQYAKVVLLAVDGDWPAAKQAAVRALAREHGADTCKHEHLEAAAIEHGQLVPQEMLDWAGEGDPATEVGSGWVVVGGGSAWFPPTPIYAGGAQSCPFESWPSGLDPLRLRVGLDDVGRLPAPRGRRC